jgi:hypothetical protein
MNKKKASKAKKKPEIKEVEKKDIGNKYVKAKEEPKAGKPGYWKAQTNAFISSFKNIPRKEFVKSAVFDFLTILAIIVIINISVILINLISAEALPQLAEIYALNQAGNTQGVNDALVEYAPVLSKVLWLSAIVAVLGSLLLIHLVSWFYGRAWAYAKGTQFPPKALRKSFVINLLWVILWIIILLITMNVLVTVAAAIATLIAFIIFFYSDPVLRATFDYGKKLGQNIKAFWRVARKIHWFIFFIIIGAIMLALLLWIAGLLLPGTTTTPTVPVLFIIVIIIFALLYLGWLRNYIIALVSHIKN